MYKEISLAQFNNPLEGQLGNTCVLYAMCNSIELQMNMRSIVYPIDLDDQLASKIASKVIYNDENKIYHDGSQMKAVLSTFNQQFLPNSKIRIKDYYDVARNPESLYDSLKNGIPVLVGIVGDIVRRNGIAYWAGSEKPMGHAMMIDSIKYDSSIREWVYETQNSWTTAGRVRIPASVLWQFGYNLLAFTIEHTGDAKYPNLDPYKDDFTILNDVDKDVIAWAISKGYVIGDNGMIRPTDKITRLETLHLLKRVIK